MAARNTTSRPVRRVVTALRSVLPPSVEVEVLQKRDSMLELKVAGRRLRAQWVGAGAPKEIRSILSHGLRPDVVVAPQMSPGARESLSQLGIGWVDELGAAEIAVGMLVVSRTGRTPKAPERTRWTPAVLSVAEALLCEVRGTVSATAEVTGLSGGACTYALRMLTEAGLLHAGKARGRGSARHVVDRDKLLEAYAAEAARGVLRLPSVVVGVSWRDPVSGLIELGRRWTRQGLAWAATGPVAAAVIAPLLTTVGTALAYVDAESVAAVEAIAASSKLRPIEGGRLTLAAFPTTTTRRLARVVDDLRVAPWPRIYVDLKSSGVRGDAAAEHLLEVIGGG